MAQSIDLVCTHVPSGGTVEFSPWIEDWEKALAGSISHQDKIAAHYALTKLRKKYPDTNFRFVAWSDLRIKEKSLTNPVRNQIARVVPSKDGDPNCRCDEMVGRCPIHDR